MPKGNGDATELMFLTGDRSAWCTLRYEDVAIKKSTSWTRLNAQILDSFGVNGIGNSMSPFKPLPKGAWTNVFNDGNDAMHPTVRCHGVGSSTGNVWWKENGNAGGINFRTNHQGMGVLARRSEPKQCTFQN